MLSPALGLKGTIDAVVSAELTDGKGHVAECLMPLELKTGKRNASNTTLHMAQVSWVRALAPRRRRHSLRIRGVASQVISYALLLGERRHGGGARASPAGLLMYPQLASTPERGHYVVAADPPLIESLLIQRNALAAALSLGAGEAGRMPPPLADAHACRFCPEAQHCAAAHAVRRRPGQGVEGGPRDGS